MTENPTRPETVKDTFKWENGTLQKIVASETTIPQEPEVVDPARIIKPGEAARIQKGVEEMQNEKDIKELAGAVNEIMKASEKPAESAGTVEVEGPVENTSQRVGEKMEAGELEELAEAVGQVMEHHSQEEIMQTLLSARTREQFYEELDRMKTAGETVKLDDGMMWDGELIKSKMEGAREILESNQPIRKADAYLSQLPAGQLRDKAEQLLKVPGLHQTVENLNNANGPAK